MSHYYDDIPPTPLEIEQGKAKVLADKLRQLPASCFTVAELELVMRVKFSRFQSDYYEAQCKEIAALAKREGIK